MIAGQNRNGYGDGHPLWITGLPPPESWRSLRQPGYPQLHRVRHPQHRVWGCDRTLEVRNFRSTKVGNFQSQLTGPTFRLSTAASTAGSDYLEGNFLVRITAKNLRCLRYGDLYRRVRSDTGPTKKLLLASLSRQAPRAYAAFARTSGPARIRPRCACSRIG